LLAETPNYLSIEMMLKATPRSEGAERFVYLEASNEGRDQQNEIVLAKALEESAGHYLKFGNLDIDHLSMPSIAAQHGITNPELYEVGVPVDVRVDGASTFVKARLFRGDTPLAEKANMVWDSMTKLNPPKRWYPSVGGMPLAKSIKIDPQTGAKIGVVSRVRWTNIALTSGPVNQHVSGVATVPFGALAKSWCGADGFDLTKALAAGYTTDVSQMTGGDAIRVQSHDGVPQSYFDFRERLAGSIRKGGVKDQSPEGLMHYCAGKFHLSLDEATEWVDRFLSDLKRGLKKRSI
jgi:hypothetical protein